MSLNVEKVWLKTDEQEIFGFDKRYFGRAIK